MPTLTLLQHREIIAKIAAVRDSFFLANISPEPTSDQKADIERLKAIFVEMIRIYVPSVMDRMRQAFLDTATHLATLGLGPASHTIAKKYLDKLATYQGTAFQNSVSTDARLESITSCVGAYLDTILSGFLQDMSDEYKLLPKQTEEKSKQYELAIEQLRQKFTIFELSMTEEQLERLNQQQNDAAELCKQQKLPNSFATLPCMLEVFKVNQTFQDNVFSEAEVKEVAGLFYSSVNHDDDEPLPLKKSQSVKPIVIVAINVLAQVRPILKTLSLYDALSCVGSKLFQQFNLLNCFKNPDDTLYRTYRALVPIVAANQAIVLRLTAYQQETSEPSAIAKANLYKNRAINLFQLSMRLVMPVEALISSLKKLTQLESAEQNLQSSMSDSARTLFCYKNDYATALEESKKFVDVVKQLTAQVNITKAAYEFIEKIEIILPADAKTFLNKSMQSIDFLLGKLLTYFNGIVSSRAADQAINNVAILETVKRHITDYKFNLSGMSTSKDPRHKLVVEIHKYYEKEVEKIAPVQTMSENQFELV